MEENENTEHTLVASTNGGRYALDDPEHGQDLTSGMVLSILIGGHWTLGHVEHQGLAYAGTYGQTQQQGGYVFVDAAGNVVGLCAGMRVKIT